MGKLRMVLLRADRYKSIRKMRKRICILQDSPISLKSATNRYSTDSNCYKYLHSILRRRWQIVSSNVGNNRRKIIDTISIESVRKHQLRRNVRFQLGEQKVFFVKKRTTVAGVPADKLARKLRQRAKTRQSRETRKAREHAYAANGSKPV